LMLYALAEGKKRGGTQRISQKKSGKERNARWISKNNRTVPATGEWDKKKIKKGR